MLEHGSYNIENFSVNKTKELNRLNSQVDLFWEQEHLLYKRLGLRDGMAVLDCGCGSGYLLEKMHARYPSMVCTGIEISDFLFTAASNAILSGNLTRCRVHKQSILNLDLPDNTFDFVIVRLVLEHLQDPLVAMREVRRVLKAGGRAVFIDNDFDFHVRTYPEIFELSQLYDAYCTARSRDGGNPRIGRQLPQLLSQTHFTDISFDVVAANNTIIGDHAFHLSEGSGIALQLLHDGYLTSEVYDRLALRWTEMLQTKGHSMIRLLFAGSGVKPDSTPPENTEHSENRLFSASPSKETMSTALSSYKKSTKGFIANVPTTIAEILGIAPETVLPGQPLGELGLDSVGSVMLKNHIENELAVSAPPIEYFYNHSINDIITFVKNTLTSPAEAGANNKEKCFEEGLL
ncbi:MAG: methyltransferase domain-containing protein [Chitinispirillaceae bacterium]|nr:methyltransferase domain-containing protein [Chitinispirillaceae bacterium]